jgi:hypothetical protein
MVGERQVQSVTRRDHRRIVVCGGAGAVLAFGRCMTHCAVWVLAFLLFAPLSPRANAQTVDDLALKHQRELLKDAGLLKEHNTKVDECKFEDPQDMMRKVNQKSLEDARKRGIELDSDRNGLNDALEGKYYGAQGRLGSYMCSEFSAYFHCMMQKLFGCTEEQVQTIEGRNHSINRVNKNIFRNPPAVSDDVNKAGWARVEPQAFFRGGGFIGGGSGVGQRVQVYKDPQPYRSGINKTNYDELECKSGPNYTEGSILNGLFGGLGSSALLGSMLNSMMDRLNPTPSPTPVFGRGSSTPTPTPTPTSAPVKATPTVTPAPSPTRAMNWAGFNGPQPDILPPRGEGDDSASGRLF